MHLYHVSHTYVSGTIDRPLTNDHNDDTDQHRPASTKSFSDKRCSHGANKAANFVDCDDQSDHVRSSIRLRVDSKRFRKSGRVDKTSHKAIIVADKKEAKTSQGRDCGKESVALEVNVGEHVECDRVRRRRLE
jgi:hypothetical protein